MKPQFLTLFFALFAGNTAFAQHDSRAELNIKGGSEGIFVTSDEKIWLATSSGDTYYTDGIEQSWRPGYFQSKRLNFSLSRIFNRILFFNDRIGLISGNIEGQNGKKDIIYRTTDGGRKWETVRFGKEAWIDATCVTENGKAWMAGNSRLLYYSDDFGETWHYKKYPEDTTDQRIQTLFFLNDREGLAGTVWNRIYYTKDNCEAWQIMETPLDQQKLQIVYSRERPEINKVVLTPTQYIVDQNNRIFYSDKDSIVWRSLPDVIAFEYDKSRNNLYLIDQQLNVFSVGDRAENARDSLGRLKKEPRSLFARNGSLYAWLGDEIARINSSSAFTTPIYTEAYPIENLSFKTQTGHKTWGVSESHVYQSGDGGKSWYRVKHLDFSIGSFKPLNDTTAVISDRDYDRYYLLHTASGRLEDYLLPNGITSAFSLDQIASVALEEISTGCFHHYTSGILFTKNGTDFKATQMISNKFRGKEVQQVERTFFGEELVLLLGLIQPENRKTPTLSDFGITEKDRATYRNIIDNLEQENEPTKWYEPFSLPFRNIDYSFFRNFENKLGSINPETLGALVSRGPGVWSTTVNTRKITIKTYDGQTLTMSNEDTNPNAWYVPWLIETNGFTYKSVRPELGRFYLKYFKGELPETENARLIFDLARQEYEAHLKNR